MLEVWANIYHIFQFWKMVTIIAKIEQVSFVLAKFITSVSLELIPNDFIAMFLMLDTWETLLSSTLCYLYLELKTLGKWSHPLYTYFVVTVNKKQSTWELKLNEFPDSITIIQILLN